MEKSWRDDYCALVPAEPFVADTASNAGVEAAEDVQVIVEDREAAGKHGETRGEKLQPGLASGLALGHALTAEEGPPDAAGNAAALPRDREHPPRAD